MESVLSGVPLAAAAAGGILATYLCEDEAPLSVRVCAGIPVGLTFFGLTALLLASLIGPTPTSAWLAAAFAGSPLLLLLRPQVRGRGHAELARASSRLRAPTRADAAGILAGLALASLLFSVFDRAAFEQDGGLLTGIDHNIGDLPFHVGVIMGFARGDNLPPEHPELAGVRLTYPILADFVVAQLLMTGMDLRAALLAQNLLLAGALAGLLTCFARVLTGDAGTARLAPWLLFLSGGLGFRLAAGDWIASGKGLLEFLLDLPRDYTITWTGELRWGNVLTTLLVPQRALLLGAPIAVLAFSLVWTALNDPSEATGRRRLRAAGLAAGLLPLAHVHAFLVTLGMAAVVAVLFQKSRAFVHFFAPALLLAAPQVAWLAADSGVKAGSVLAWQFGWDRGGRNPVCFWLDNAGLLLPLQAWALWRARRTPLVRFQVPFLLLFATANLLKLSPWIWDNIKFLFFWHVAAVPMVAGLLASLWRQGAAGRLASGALTVSLLLAGGLDLWRVASRQIALPIFEREARALAAGPLAATPPRALILHAPVPSSPVYLAGRRSLLGYPGHIWSQGLDAGDREQRIRRIYAGAHEARDLLVRSGVDYVLVGPQERRWTRVDEAFLGRFELVAEQGPYRMWKCR